MHSLKYATANFVRTTGILLGAAVCLTLPIYFWGMPGGNDLPQHYRFTIAFYDALRNGDLYPAWIGETNLGYGDAGVRFYPPLAYYVVAMFRFFVSSWNVAIASAVCFWFFVGGTGMYLLAREWFFEKASIVAALVFMVMPYHANQVYNAGLFAEFAGLAILPFCFLFVRRIVAVGGMMSVAGLSISYALLILSHLPLTIVGSAALLIFSVALLINERARGGAVGKLAISVAIAVAASSFYWIRLVTELAFVKHSLPEFADKAYDFRLNFLASLFYVPAEKYGETSLWFTDLLFAITLAMIVPSLLICLRPDSDIDRRKLTSFVAVFVFALFVGTPLSAPLWEHAGVLQKIQFPWRLLGLISLAGSLAIAASYEQMHGLFRSKLRPAGIVAVGLITAGVVFTFAQVIRPAAYPSLAEFDRSFDTYRSDRSYECWWPVWANAEAFKYREQVGASSRPVQVVKWSDQEREFAVGEGSADQLRVATFYYPLWNATSGTQRLNVEPADDGTILISVPADASRVRLFFAEPQYEKVAELSSLATWLLLVTVLAVSQIRRMALPKIE